MPPLFHHWFKKVCQRNITDWKDDLKREETEKSVKQLTLETIEAVQNEKEDESASVKQKQMDACAYMAFVKKQPKKVIAAGK